VLSVAPSDTDAKAKPDKTAPRSVIVFIVLDHAPLNQCGGRKEMGVLSTFVRCTIPTALEFHVTGNGEVIGHV
jgi:hypothetical protein